MLRFETAGESHGECLVATLNGLPAGIPISLDAVNRELWRRQQGYGRGGGGKQGKGRAGKVAGGGGRPHHGGAPPAPGLKKKKGRKTEGFLPGEVPGGGGEWGTVCSP